MHNKLWKKIISLLFCVALKQDWRTFGDLTPSGLYSTAENPHIDNIDPQDWMESNEFEMNKITVQK